MQESLNLHEAYIAGFIDGEGCLTLAKTYDKRGL